MQLREGQYIRHAKYGLGTILSRDDARTTVEFDVAGVKTFVTSLATFEAAEGAPPAKKRSSRRRKPPVTPS